MQNNAKYFSGSTTFEKNYKNIHKNDKHKVSDSNYLWGRKYWDGISSKVLSTVTLMFYLNTHTYEVCQEQV